MTTFKPQTKPPGVVAPAPQNAPQGKPGLHGDGDKSKKAAGKHIKRIIASPCNRPPETPAHVDMKFHVREQETHLKFGAKIRWDEVVEDTSGLDINTVDRYEVMWRALDKQGDPVPQEDQYWDPLVAATNPTGSTFEFVTKKGNSIHVGDDVTISGCVPTGYNGTWHVTGHPDPDDGRKFRVNGNTSGLVAATQTGHVADTNPQTHHRRKVKQPTEKAHIKAAFNDEVRNVSGASNPTGTFGGNPANQTFRYTVPAGFTFGVGVTVTITDMKPNLWNKTGVVTRVPDATHFEINGAQSGVSDASEGGRVKGSVAGSTVYTFELNKPHNQFVGNKVRISSCRTPNDYNGVYIVTKIVDATTLEVDGDAIGTATCQHPGTLADADDSMFIVTGTLLNPKTWAWQGRVRCRAGKGCWSAWSDWTPAVIPWSGEDTKPPSPEDVRLTFDSSDGGHHNRVTAILSFTDVGWEFQGGQWVNVGWDIPGGDHEDDADRYFAKLEASRNGISNWHRVYHKFHADSDDDDDHTVKVRFPGIRPNFYYRGRVKTYDKYNRKSFWSFLTAPLSPTDTKPPAPEDVIALRQVDAVAVSWDDPIDPNTTLPLDDPPDNTRLASPEVDHYQVEVSTDRNFNVVRRQWRHRAASGIVSYDTEHYRQRYWFRVRSVNESGYKSPWVYSDGVRPAQTKAARTVLPDKTISPSQVDMVGDYPLSGGLSNQAYITSDADIAWAVADGESADGELEAVVVTGSNVSRIYGGVTFRFQDGSNFLFFGIATGGCAFGKVQAGTLSNLSTSFMTINEETTYVLRVVADDINIKCYLDNVLKVTTTSTLFMTATKHGWVTRRLGALYDNGEMRFDDIRFTPVGEVLPSIDDNFDRIATEEVIPPPPAGGTQEFRGLMALSGMDGAGGTPPTTYGRFNMSLVFTQTITT